MTQCSNSAGAASDPLVRICAYVLGGIWIFQGLVPKLLGPHADEIAMIRAVGVPLAYAPVIAHVSGLLEIGLGLCIILLREKPLIYGLSSATILGLSLLVVASSASFLFGAFNAVTINAAMLALAAIAGIRLNEIGRAN
jgi:hypothetical protein